VLFFYTIGKKTDLQGLISGRFEVDDDMIVYSYQKE